MSLPAVAGYFYTSSLGAVTLLGFRNKSWTFLLASLGLAGAWDHYRGLWQCSEAWGYGERPLDAGSQSLMGGWSLLAKELRRKSKLVSPLLRECEETRALFKARGDAWAVPSARCPWPCWAAKQITLLGWGAVLHQSTGGSTWNGVWANSCQRLKSNTIIISYNKYPVSNGKKSLAKQE